MIDINIGEHILFNQPDNNWHEVLTKADFDYLSTMPRKLLNTMLLAVTGGANGVMYGGHLSHFVNERVFIQPLVAVYLGKLMIYADPSSNLYGSVSPNNSTNTQYCSFFIRYTQLESNQEKREFREDYKVSKTGTVTDSTVLINTRLIDGIEVITIQSDKLITTCRGAIYRGYAVVFPGQSVPYELVNVTDDPLTVSAHSNPVNSSNAPAFDHPDESITSDHLSDSIMGDYGADTEETLESMSDEIIAAKANLPTLNDMISKIADADGIIVTDQLQTIVDDIIKKRLVFESDEYPSFLNRSDGGEYSVNVNAIKKAAGSLTKVSAISGLVHCFNSNAYINAMSLPPSFPIDQNPVTEWKKSLFGFAAFAGNLDESGEPVATNELKTLQIVCTVKNPNQVACYMYASLNTEITEYEASFNYLLFHVEKEE
jgi:hypothetical protein